MIEHGGLLRVFPSLAQKEVLGMSRGSTPNYTQIVRYLGFAKQNTAPLSPGRIVPE